MNTAPYATPDGIRTYLASLEGLHLLREDRRLAAARFERLPAYCVLGSYLLTEDGRFGELTGVSARPTRDVPDVVTFEEFDRRGRRAYGEKWRVSYRTPAPLAPYDRLCPECGNGWTFRQHADVVEIHDARTVLLAEDDGRILTDRVARVIRMHVACHETLSAHDAARWSDDILVRSGFGDADQEPCEPLDRGYGRWFRFATAAGTVRFGPRGPGFAIDWSETGKDLAGTFCRIEYMTLLGPVWNDPLVPHGPFHVDPKDETYLVLYLERLRLALGL